MEFYLGILLGLVALCAIVWAFVRSRVGDEPHCRGCGFSLAGLSDPEVCPECGRSISRRRAVVVGDRRSRKKLVVVFLVLGGLSSALLWLDGASRRGFIPVSGYKPAWLLMGEAYLLDDQRASAATDEIVDRVQAGELTSEHQDKLLSIALRRHAQTWRGFPDSQWVVIMEAYTRNQLDTQQIFEVMSRYIEGLDLVDPKLGEAVFAPGETRDLTFGIHLRRGNLATTPIEVITAIRTSDHDIFLLNHDYYKPKIRSSLGPHAFAGITSGSHDNFAYSRLYVPWVPGEFEGYFELQLDLTQFYMRASDRSTEDGIRVRVDPEIGTEYSTIQKENILTYKVPIEFEVVASEAYRYSVLEADSLGSSVSSAVEFVQKGMYWSDTTKLPMMMTYTIGLNDSFDEESLGLAGFVVARQGDTVSRDMITHWVDGSPGGGQLSLFHFKPGEVRLTYEHNEAVAVRAFRHVSVSKVLGGPVDLGTITIPEPPEPAEPADP